MKKSILLVTILVFGFISMIYAIVQAHEQVVEYNEVSFAGYLKGNTSFEFVIKSAPFNEKLHSGRLLTPPKRHFWGHDKQFPDHVIDKLSLTIGGVKVEIPDYAWLDLCDVILPAGVGLMQSDDDVSFYINGGDGVGGYQARLIVKNRKVRAREIKHLDAKGDWVIEKQIF